ncbi:MAG TPA: Eco57I restriction-modification methylase domain-containing protein [Candidatus Woesearchaeota archaeon]|nr:Eco57I restriction-modification methylase domain-containing protein [Candidatus Woesearchaeota archaeon]
MNEQQAKWLLDETFNQEFDVLKFSNFLKELVNNSNLYTQDKTQFVAGEFRDYILKVEKLGQYKDKAGKSMELLAIKLAKHSSLERARTMQRNFIAKWLAKNPDEPEGAIVGFYDDEKDWRFSFVKLEYNLIKDEKGNLKAKKELTPAKRYSYLVGPNEPNHTCKKQFVELLSSDHDPLFEEIERSFGIEKVTKEFFEEYKKRFLDLKESLEKVIKNDAVVKAEFVNITGEENLERYVVEFSKKLLGQIVFLYFLQKKGWLGVRKDDTGRFKDWGTGPKDFMKRLFNREYCSYNNFFNDVLEPLFYNTLAIKRNDDFSDKFDCKIPFLNGGLFEPLDGYDWMNTNIYIENSIFEDIFRTFDEFNFTVKEDEPLEKEVAVDPEMLGKVFENLLEVTDRKSKGAFYTPREIVHYMCQQSLINYLETNSSIPRKDIEKFIQEGDKYLDQTIKAQEHKKKYHGNVYGVDSEYTIPKSIEENCEKIDDLLRTIKVVDPAVGSGAFPVGMMNEIVKARSILSIYFDSERDVSEIKRECIENSLYGVDIMPSAVDICQLRFWLSLVVDELDRKKIKPLPNLDNKIMCGNSLLEEFEGVKLFDDSLLGEEVKDIRPELDRIEKEIKELNLKAGEIILGKSKGSIDDIKKAIKKLEREKNKLTTKPETKDTNLTLTNFDKVTRDEAKIKLKKLKAKQKEFFNSFDRDTKKQLKQEIEKLEWELIEATLKQQGNEEAIKKLNSIMKSKSKPFFLWKLYFAEVFQRENPGFDVVIGNPPYVRQEEIKEYKEVLKNNYESANGTADLYCYFLELSHKILRLHASSAFITSNKYLRANYGVGIREFLLKQTNISKLLDFGGYKVFDTATVDTIISIFKKETGLSNNIECVNFKKTFSESSQLSNFIARNKFIIKQSNLSKSGWVLLNNNYLELKNKIESKGEQIDKSFKIYRGITTGANSAFLVDNIKINEYNLEPELLRPILQGKEIYRYHTKKAKNNLIYSYTGINIEKYPNIKKHLDNYKELLENVWEAKHGKKEYYELRGCKYYNEFLKSKIIWCDIANQPSFTYDENKHFLLNTAFMIIGNRLKTTLAILNSNVSKYWFLNTSSQLGESGLRFIPEFVERFPLSSKTIFDNQIIQLVDQILSITKDEDYLKNPDKQAKVKKLEKEIDKLVYQLYELTSDEIKIVEEFNEK